MALFSGWVFLIRPDDSAECKSSLLPRYMVLADRSIVTYRHDPAVYPDEVGRVISSLFQYNPSLLRSQYMNMSYHLALS